MAIGGWGRLVPATSSTRRRQINPNPFKSICWKNFINELYFLLNCPAPAWRNDCLYCNSYTLCVVNILDTRVQDVKIKLCDSKYSAFRNSIAITLIECSIHHPWNLDSIELTTVCLQENKEKKIYNKDELHYQYLIYNKSNFSLTLINQDNSSDILPHHM